MNTNKNSKQDKNIKISVPGSTMLSGEHAVVYGHEAIVCAINKRILIEITPNNNNTIKISSNLGDYESNVKQIKKSEKFRFIILALKIWKEYLTRGIDIKIESNFSSKVGFGSSAAVTVGIIAALQKLFLKKINLQKVYYQSLQIIRSIQGSGSGADIAASTYGGTLQYKTIETKGNFNEKTFTEKIIKKNIKKLVFNPKISLIYCGYKNPTKKVLEKISAARKKNKAKYNNIFSDIEKCSRICITAILEKNWTKLGKIFDLHQALQKKLGTSDKNLEALIKAANALPGIYGSKISGSGLGDCIITLGKLPKKFFPSDETQKRMGVQQFEVEVSNKGLIDETDKQDKSDKAAGHSKHSV